MHKIFVGDKPLILTTKLEEETDFKNYLLSTVNIGNVIIELKNDKIASIRLIEADKDLLFKKFLISMILKQLLILQVV